MIARCAFFSAACLDVAVACLSSEPSVLATALQYDDECGAADAATCSLELTQLRASKLLGAGVPSGPGSSASMPRQSLAQRFERELRRDMAKASAADGKEEDAQVAQFIAGLALRAQHAVASSHELGREVDELKNDLAEINNKEEELAELHETGIAESHDEKDDSISNLPKQAAARLAAQNVHGTNARRAASTKKSQKTIAEEDTLEEDEVKRKRESDEDVKSKLIEHEDDKLRNRDHRLCDPVLSLDLSAATVTHSNLGGQGPDSGAETLVYEGITSTDGQQVDMIVSALSSYIAHDSTKNGIHDGAFGMINMEVNTAAEILFRFVSHATGSAVIMHPFYFSFFDLDQGMAHESREQITVKGFSSYSVAEETELTIDAESDDEATFVSTYRGGKVDNPTFPNSLSELQRSRSVAVRFDNVSEFAVAFGEINYAASQGRNFFFSGISSLVCPRESKCSTFECPSGYHIRTMAEFLVCAASPCTSDDRDTCCYEEEDDASDEEESDDDSKDTDDADNEDESDAERNDANDEEEGGADNNDAEVEEENGGVLDA